MTGTVIGMWIKQLSSATPIWSETCRKVTRNSTGGGASMLSVSQEGKGKAPSICGCGKTGITLFLILKV